MLKQLKNIRNELAHHASKSVSDAEFNQFWTDLSTILVALGDDSSKLDKLRDDDDVFGVRTQPINEENVKEAKRWNSLGTKAHKEEKFAEAVSLFIKATVLSDVADRDRAIFFSNMAASRLSLYEREHRSDHTSRSEIEDISDERYRALQDTKQARNLWSTWWKGHFRVGKVYAALNEHEKAINSFERALALAPTNNEIQKALDESRQIHGRILRHEHLDPRLSPKTMPEVLTELNQKLGIDPMKVRMGHDVIGTIYPAGADVVKGHKYTHGDDGVKQDYEQAAGYFAKAASQGNAEGMYNLAWLTDRGLGVKKDHQAALKLLQQAAAQPPMHPILECTRNIGVAEAEHSLGLRYAEGVSVHKDLPTAAYWYERAADHGSAESANNLALMYLHGNGVDKNIQKAEQLLRLSSKRGDSNAMLTLAGLLLRNEEFETAKMWYNCACEAGNMVAKLNRDMFEKIIANQQKFARNCPSVFSQITNMMKNMADSMHTRKTAHALSRHSYLFDYDMLSEHANQGSITAERLCDALDHFVQAFNIVMHSESVLQEEEEENTIVRELSQCHRTEHIVAQYPTVKIRQKIDAIVDRVLHRCSTRSNSVASQLDEDARICYSLLHMDSHEFVLEFLNACKQKYPKTSYFFQISACVHGFSEQYEEALYDANAALELAPNDCELLYSKAVALRLMDKTMNEAIEAYRNFLAVAPNDHRKVPESYYAIASCYLELCGLNDLVNVRKNYKQGEEAEKIQLPCFLPYDSSNKTLLKPLVHLESFFDMKPNSTLDRKSRLNDPHRIELITEHRQWENCMSHEHLDSNCILVCGSHEPRTKQQIAKSLVGLKPITLREMSPIKDHVYIGYVLSATIIDGTSSWTPSIHLIIEDEHLHCERMHIYNFPEEKAEYLTNKMFTVGSKVHIINPYLRIGAGDRKSLIRVDDFSSIIMESEAERVINLCRCCGKANAPHVCSKCKQARYCSKECQKMDWQLYKHKLICKSE